jgi:hypothetical protein
VRAWRRRQDDDDVLIEDGEQVPESDAPHAGDGGMEPRPNA